MDAFDGKNIFMTGSTGFVGKVFLEKILRTFPGVGGLYLLIRPSKKESVEQRGQAIFRSACFDRLRKEIGDDQFNALVTDRVHFLAGDICDESLGLPDSVRDELASKLHYVVHSAATLDFTERLDIATTTNYLGTLRCFALAARAVECGDRGAVGPFLCFLHVSTCYVNWRKRTDVPEIVYPVGFPTDFTAADILDTAQTGGTSAINELSERLQQRFVFPNTYTLTKAMAEVALVERAGDVPICIVRPAIIGASAVEPTPGWVDNVSAVGAVLFFASLGVIHHFLCPEEAVLDIIPVDYVVNDMLKSMLVTARAVLQRPDRPVTALPAGVLTAPALGTSCREELRQPLKRPAGLPSITRALTMPSSRFGVANSHHFVEPEMDRPTPVDPDSAAASARRLRSTTLWPVASTPGLTAPLKKGFVWVSHSAATGASRGTTARMLKRYCGAFWVTHRPRKAISDFSFELISSPLYYASVFFLTKDLPSYLFLKAVEASPFSTPKQLKEAQQIRKAVGLAKRCGELMFPFSFNTPWVFLLHNNHAASASLPAVLQEALPSDMASLDHPQYLLDFSWGMHYNILKEKGPSLVRYL